VAETVASPHKISPRHPQGERVWVRGNLLARRAAFTLAAEAAPLAMLSRAAAGPNLRAFLAVDSAPIPLRQYLTALKVADRYVQSRDFLISLMLVQNLSIIVSQRPMDMEIFLWMRNYIPDQ